MHTLNLESDYFGFNFTFGFLDRFLSSNSLTTFTIDDFDLEDDEHFFVRLSLDPGSFGNFVVVQNTTTIVIIDNELPGG